MSVHGDSGASGGPKPRPRRRGWLALVSLLAGFWSASAAAAPAPAGRQLAPVAAPAAPVSPSAPATSCQTATLPQLTSLLDRLPRESVVPATEIMPDNAESAVTYLHPNGTGGHVGFVAFLAPITPANQFDPAGANVLTVVRVDHPPNDAAKSTLSTTDSQNAYELHLQAPQLTSWNPRQRRILVVFACSDAGGVSQPIGYAVRPVTLSTQEAATIVGAAIVLGVYLLAATMVWSQRKADARRGNKLQATPPTRIKPIVAWPWPQCLDPVWMTSDMFDRASLSKLQILFFALVVSFGVTYSVVRTGALSDLSSSIVLLLGIPAVGALGNQAVAVTRDRISLDNWAWLANRGVFPINDPGNDTPRWRDLVMSDGELDLYKLQALLFSVIVGVALISSGFYSLATFKVPDTLMQILGLSQVVFVGGRLTKATTIGDIDDLVTELRDRAGTVRLAARTGIDVDNTGKLLQSPVPASPPFGGPLTLEMARERVPNAVARYDETEAEVKILLDQMTHRNVETEDRLKDPLAV
jgi:hypothetical protein